MARPKKDVKTRMINMKIDEKIFEMLDDASVKTGISKTALTEKAIKEYLDNHKKEIKAFE